MADMYIHSRYGMHRVVPAEADTPWLQAQYDRALAESFTQSRAGKSHVRYWFDDAGMHVKPVDIWQRNPRARALIDAVVSLILH